MTTFSERHGFRPPDADITIRQDAPAELRSYLVDLAYECGMAPATVRTVVCRVLRRRPDPSNWSPFPNIDGETRQHLDECEWFEVYDVVEALYREASRSRLFKEMGESRVPLEVHFENELN